MHVSVYSVYVSVHSVYVSVHSWSIKEQDRAPARRG